MHIGGKNNRFGLAIMEFSLAIKKLCDVKIVMGCAQFGPPVTPMVTGKKLVKLLAYFLMVT